MVNPTKSSDSLAPTMAICCLCAWLTLLLFQQKSRVVTSSAAVWLGLLLGFAVDVRIANLLLSVGYVACFALEQIVPGWRRPNDRLQACIFGVCMAIGIAPTLIANYINVGNPFASAYIGADVAMPDFNIGDIAGSLFRYAHGNQGIMLLIALGLTIFFCKIWGAFEPTRHAYVVLIVNLFVNMGFYLTHQIYTPYYAMAIATLTIWTVLFFYAQVPSPVADKSVSTLGLHS
jgi:hypothetical protein